MVHETGREVPDPVAARVRLGFLQVGAVVEAQQPVPGGQVSGDVGGEDPAAVDLPGFRWQVPQAHRFGGADAVGFDDGVLAVHDVDVLGVVAAGNARYPAVGDVGAGDRVLPAGLALVVRQVPQVPARRLDPPGDPPQPARPVPGPGHQAGDLGDVLVLFGRAVLPGAGLPRAGGDVPDGVLVGGGDHPAAGEQQDPARGGQGQQVLDEVMAGPGPVDADQDLGPEPGRDLPDGRGQHLLVVGEGVRARVAGPQQHGQALAGIRRPRP